MHVLYSYIRIVTDKLIPWHHYYTTTFLADSLVQLHSTNSQLVAVCREYKSKECNTVCTFTVQIIITPYIAGSAIYSIQAAPVRVLLAVSMALRLSHLVSSHVIGISQLVPNVPRPYLKARDLLLMALIAVWLVRCPVLVGNVRSP